MCDIQTAKRSLQTSLHFTSLENNKVQSVWLLIILKCLLLVVLQNCSFLPPVPLVRGKPTLTERRRELFCTRNRNKNENRLDPILVRWPNDHALFKMTAWEQFSDKWVMAVDRWDSLAAATDLSPQPRTHQVVWIVTCRTSWPRPN